MAWLIDRNAAVSVGAIGGVSAMQEVWQDGYERGAANHITTQDEKIAELERKVLWDDEAVQAYKEVNSTLRLDKEGRMETNRILRESVDALRGRITELEGVVAAYRDRDRVKAALSDHLYADNGGGEHYGLKPCGCYHSPHGEDEYECATASSLVADLVVARQALSKEPA